MKFDLTDFTEGRHSAQETSLYADRNNAKDMGDKLLQLLDNESNVSRCASPETIV